MLSEKRVLVSKLLLLFIVLGPLVACKGGRAVNPHADVGVPPTSTEHPGPKPHHVEEGVMSYDPPKVMTLNHSETIDAVIRRPGDGSLPLALAQDEALKLGLSRNDSLVNEKIPVSEGMLVTLRSEEAGAFKIDPPEADATKDSRYLSVGGHAAWHWTVTPLSEGTKHLVLHSIFVLHLKNGETQISDQDDYPTTITIVVAPWYGRLWSGLVDGLADHWIDILKYFLPASGAALVAGWWKRRKREPGAASE